MSSQISHRNEFGRKRGDRQDDYLQIHGSQVIVLSVNSFPDLTCDSSMATDGGAAGGEKKGRGKEK